MRPGCHADSNPAGRPTGQVFRRPDGVVGQPQFLGNDIGGSTGQNTQRRVPGDKTVDDLIYRSVSPANQHQVAPLRYGGPCQARGFGRTRSRGELHGHSARFEDPRRLASLLLTPLGAPSRNGIVNKGDVFQGEIRQP